MKRQLMTVLIAMVSTAAFAHDEGHGPKVKDAPRYGGKVSAVVNKADSGKGASAEMIHKAELVHSKDGTVRLYLANKDGGKLALDKFKPTAKGVLMTEVGGKHSETPFELNAKNNVFVGKVARPKAGGHYDIDVTVTEGETELLSAFDGMK